MESLPRTISSAFNLFYPIAPRPTFVALLVQQLPAGVTPVVKPERVMTVHTNVSDEVIDGWGACSIFREISVKVTVKHPDRILHFHWLQNPCLLKFFTSNTDSPML